MITEAEAKAIEAAFHAHGNAPIIVDVQTAYNAMRAAISAYEQALWRPIEEAPKGEIIDLWVETIVTAKSHIAKNGKRIVRDCRRNSSDPMEFVDSSGRSVNHVCFYNFEGDECLIWGNDAVLPEHNKGEIIRHIALLWRPRPLPPPPEKEG